MCRPRLRTNVVRMTMNWYVAESLMNERSQAMSRAQERRWPELDHARRLRSAHEAEVARLQLPRRPVGTSPVTPPTHRFGNFLHGLVVGRAIAQR